MKAKTLNKLIKDYAKIFENLGFKLNPDFKKEYLHIKRMKTNSTKISFIKADKIEGLKKNVKGFKLKPNDTEQREKYFTAVKPSKFLDNMLLKHNRQSIFSGIAEEFNKAFIYNLKNKLVLFSGADIGKQYSNNDSIVGCMSDMQGRNEDWFNVYRDTEGLQLATLSDAGNTMLIRALLWYDKESNNYWLDKTYEQPSINGDDEVRQEYQKKLIVQVLEHLKANVPSFPKDKRFLSFGFGCAFAQNLSTEVVQEIAKDFNTTIYKDVQRLRLDSTGEPRPLDKDRVTLNPIIKDFDCSDYEYYPYSDTFQSIGRSSGKWFLNCNSGDTKFVCCRSTEGEDENDSGQNCDCCDERITDEDYIHYSELEQEYICDDCSTYIDERDDSCRSDNAIYNNYTGNYHYSGDIQ